VVVEALFRLRGNTSFVARRRASEVAEAIEAVARVEEMNSRQRLAEFYRAIIERAITRAPMKYCRPSRSETNTAAGGVRAIRFLFRFAVVFACLDYVLGLFPWTRQVARYGSSLLFDPLRTMGNGLVDALPGLVLIAIVIVMTRYVLRITSLFFGGIASGRIRPAGFDQNWAWPTFRLVRIAIIAFAVVLAHPYIPGSKPARTG
jgi:hypothetical protein